MPWPESFYAGAPWWREVKAGDRLRHPTLHTDGATGLPKQVDALLHVLAVFDHDGDRLLTAAEWLPSRHRWHYETFSVLHAARSKESGGIYRDGFTPPR